MNPEADQNESFPEQNVPKYPDQAERLAKFAEYLKLDIPEMARELDEEYKTYLNYHKGARRLPPECRVKFYKMGMDLNWLETGETPMVRPKTEESPLARAILQAAAPAPGKVHALSEDVFNAIQKAAMSMESLTRAVPSDLREGIEIRQMGFFTAQMVEYLLAGQQEKILEMQAHFLSQVPRTEKKT